MIRIALENGIKPTTYYSRINALGWSKEKAATTKAVAYSGEYAVYKNDELVVMGTAEECAAEMNVSVNYIKWMTTNAAKCRLEQKKDPINATTAVRLDD